TLKVIFTGEIGTPLLNIDEQSWPLQKAGYKSFIIEKDIPSGRSISLSRLGFTVARWNYTLLPDTPPKLALTGKADILKDSTIRVPIKLYDDYGVQYLAMHM